MPAPPAAGQTRRGSSEIAIVGIAARSIKAGAGDGDDGFDRRLDELLDGQLAQNVE
jgi:hypothetical protein